MSTLPRRAEGLHAWQIDVLDRRQPIRDFGGQASTGAALATRWQARFTPTVLFLDQQCRELAGRLVGVAVPDFYGAYPDQALAEARHPLSRPA